MKFNNFYKLLSISISLLIFTTKTMDQSVANQIVNIQKIIFKGLGNKVDLNSLKALQQTKASDFNYFINTSMRLGIQSSLRDIQYNLIDIDRAKIEQLVNENKNNQEILIKLDIALNLSIELISLNLKFNRFYISYDIYNEIKNEINKALKIVLKTVNNDLLLSPKDLIDKMIKKIKELNEMAEKAQKTGQELLKKAVKDAKTFAIEHYLELINKIVTDNLFSWFTSSSKLIKKKQVTQALLTKGKEMAKLQKGFPDIEKEMRARFGEIEKVILNPLSKNWQNQLSEAKISKVQDASQSEFKIIRDSRISQAREALKKLNESQDNLKKTAQQARNEYTQDKINKITEASELYRLYMAAILIIPLIELNSKILEIVKGPNPAMRLAVLGEFRKSAENAIKIWNTEIKKDTNTIKRNLNDSIISINNITKWLNLKPIERELSQETNITNLENLIKVIYYIAAINDLTADFILPAFTD